MKYYIIAGEASGDLHASNLIRELQRLDPSGVYRACGGDKMQEQGAQLLMHYRQMSFMGFTEVLANIRSILSALRICKNDILLFKPDVLILVDYPGFNLRVAKFAHRQGIKVFYYISPQVWAWKSSRVFQIKKWVDRMFVILPFEKAFYARYGVDVDFTGHPLLDAIRNYKQHDNKGLQVNDDRRIIALLPGSRKQEVAKMLKVMLAIIPDFPDCRFIIAGSSSIPKSFYEQIIGKQKPEVVYDQTYDLLDTASAALVTSGTATLETALFNVPQVVCYKAGWLSYQIARRLVKVKYISLVNLIMDRLVVKELIQQNFNRENLTQQLALLLNNKDVRSRMINDYADLEERLGKAGTSAKTAALMMNYLKLKQNND
jgi:lipid-A-disaccharide synthase